MRCWLLMLWALCGIGFAAADEPPPAERAAAPRNPTSSTRATIAANGQRSITFQTQDEKVEIQERDGGKEITIRHEKKVNGETKKAEYKAADLETLKKQHPEAAELYRRATERIAVRPFPQFPNGMPQFGFVGGPALAPGQGVRSVSATVKGQRVQIDDRYGSKIEMSVTRTVDGKDVTEKYSAADVAALKAEHPEAAALYLKITGTN